MEKVALQIYKTKLLLNVFVLHSHYNNYLLEIMIWWYRIHHTVRRFYFATAEVRFMFSSSFRKLGLAFNLEYLCQFFINFNNQCQFWNPHDEQITNLSLIFKINEEITEKIGNEKDEDEINFWKISVVFNLKYLGQNFIKLSM